MTLDGDKADRFIRHACEFVDQKLGDSGVKGKMNIFEFDFSWDFVESHNKRTAKSIHTPKNIHENVVKDLKKFISAGLKEEIHTNIANEIDKELMPKI